MNDFELTLDAVQTQASRQRGEALARIVLATGRLMTRPFRGQRNAA